MTKEDTKALLAPALKALTEGGTILIQLAGRVEMAPEVGVDVHRQSVEAIMRSLALALQAFEVLHAKGQW